MDSNVLSRIGTIVVSEVIARYAYPKPPFEPMVPTNQPEFAQTPETKRKNISKQQKNAEQSLCMLQRAIRLF